MDKKNFFLMRHNIFLALLIIATFIFCGCSDNLFYDSAPFSTQFDESDIIKTRLSLSVNDFQLSSTISTRNENPSEDAIEITSEWEEEVDNIWVFQYDENGELLIEPRYYTIENSETNDMWDIELKPNVNSRIYIVTNVNSDSWANDYNDFLTISKLSEKELPFPRPLYDISSDAVEGHIPMQGYKDAIVSGSMIEVPLERMYAKVKLRVILDKAIDEYDPHIGYVEFSSIPWFCKVGTLYDNNDIKSQDDEYPTDADLWVSRSLGTNGVGNNTNDPNNEKLKEEGEIYTYDYVIYVPENIQGEKTNNLENDTKTDVAPNHASRMIVNLKYTNTDGAEAEKDYIVYPGGNNYNNYNIRRNQVYRVTMNIGYPIEPDPVPSANCIVASPNTLIYFEPYYRLEKGGDYDIKTYLDPEDETKQIRGVKILWQTENCIGNNSAGDLVYFVPSNPQTLHDKIYVTTKEPGNAVIAAYNDVKCEGDIIWSWHIWVTQEDPTNIGNAITYYTYQWDGDGIYGYETGVARVPGYGCMPCNLGALASVPTDETGDGTISTYGLLYQWGRKDPFPALKGAAINDSFANYGEYTESTTENLWDNDYNEITGMTDETTEEYLFHSVTATEIINNQYDVQFSIQNPTVFMCGTELAAQRSSDYVGGSNSSSSYTSGIENYPTELGGDWKVTHDERLWGAAPITSDMKCYAVGEDRDGDTAHLYDDYGEKSIFDPCPYGWRVSPPDQWLGFTIDGLNPTNSNYTTNINCIFPDDVYGYGMYLYMQDWRKGLKSYFPTQGTRAPDGSGSRPIDCGNYHNATADAGKTIQRVNILHIHRSGNFNIFELDILAYYVKSVAGPVRCVRDSR